MPRDIPIIFSAPMVRALLREAAEPGCIDGKTTTRRIITQARVFATPERPAWTLKGDAMSRALQNAGHPWVIAPSFRVIKANIDAQEAQAA